MQRVNTNIQLFVLLAFFSELGYLFVAHLGDLSKSVPWFLAAYGFIFLLYAIAALRFFDITIRDQIPVKRGQAARMFASRFWRGIRNLMPTASWRNIPQREIFVVGLLFGVLFRLTLLTTTPTLSEDIFRYVWEGNVSATGINPFEHPPESEELSPLRDEVIYPRINHKEISTVYPPLSQLVFWGLAHISYSVPAFKVAFILLDLATIGVLILLLKALSINRNRVLLYVWNPLIIVEFSGSGHADIIGILLLSASLYFAAKYRSFVSIFFLALSVLTKYIAIVLLPFIALAQKKNRIMVILLFIVITGCLFLPYIDAGEKLFSGLMVYSEKWQFNSSIFEIVLRAVKSTIQRPIVREFLIGNFGVEEQIYAFDTKILDLALKISKWLIVVIYSAIFVTCLATFPRDISRSGPVHFFRLGLVLVGSFLLLNPTLHPWYLCWLMPFLIVVPNRAWLLFTGLVMLSYWVVIDYEASGIWQESTLAKCLEYLPVYALFVFGWIKTKYVTRKRSVRIM